MNKETDYQPMEDAESTSSKAEAAKPVETGGTRKVRKWVHKAKSGNFIYFLPALLVFYSILKEIKVGEPFMYLYHTQFLNYTAKTLNGDIHPWSAYAYLVAIIPIFLFTDIFLYKPVMYLEVLGQFAYRFTLVFTNNLLSQQIGQACYGIAMASEVAFFSYIYGRLEKNQYKRLTSWTRAGTMAGRTGGYIFAQIMILTQTGTYLTLNKIAFYVPVIAICLCFLMPRVSWKTLVDRIKASRERKVSRRSLRESIPTKPKPSKKKITQLYRHPIQNLLYSDSGSFAPTL
uniref:Folate transporter 1, chloroplastic n=1 Tax=Panagrellus redivivus TaxID=6233 RepID=A0A7E4VBS9_PANRE